MFMKTLRILKENGVYKIQERGFFGFKTIKGKEFAIREYGDNTKDRAIRELNEIVEKLELFLAKPEVIKTVYVPKLEEVDQTKQ